MLGAQDLRLVVGPLTFAYAFWINQIEPFVGSTRNTPPVGNPYFDPPGKQEKSAREEGKVPQGELRTYNREEGRV